MWKDCPRCDQRFALQASLNEHLRECGGQRETMEYTEAHEPHHDQAVVWTEQVAEALLPWLKDFDSYDDKVAFLTTLQDELTDIGVAAHAAGMLRERAKKA